MGMHGPFYTISISKQWSMKMNAYQLGNDKMKNDMTNVWLQSNLHVIHEGSTCNQNWKRKMINRKKGGSELENSYPKY